MLPIIVSTPEPMLRVRVVTTKDGAEQTLKALHQLGVLHVEQSTELSPVDAAAIEDECSKVKELVSQLSSVLAYAPEEGRVSPPVELQSAYVRPLEEVKGEVGSLCANLAALHRRVDELDREVRRLGEMHRYLRALGEQTEATLLDLNYAGQYLFSRVLALPKEAFEAAQQTVRDCLLTSISALAGDEIVWYVVARRYCQEEIEQLAHRLEGQVLAIPREDLLLQEYLVVLERQISVLEEELARARGELERQVREHLGGIILLIEVLSAEEERLLVLGRACEAKYVTLVEGWIPQGNIEAAVSEIRQRLSYVFIDSREPVPKDEPPTRMRNARGVKPFQVLIALFGIPRYGEWDPTPIVAYSFAFFFGLMIADVAYALGIMLTARYLLDKMVEDPRSEGVRLFKNMLYISSTVALVVGLLAGSYLGDAYSFFGVQAGGLALAQSVRMFVSDPIWFIILSLIIGLIHVNIAYVLSLVKGLKRGDKGEVLNKVALFVLQIFGVPLVTHSLLHTDILPIGDGAYSAFRYVVIASVLMVIVSAFMQKGVLGGIFWIFDLTGLLGDVMSYARLAGVSLATFYLAASFNMIAKFLGGIVASVLPGVFGVVVGAAVVVVILVVAHVFNMILSLLTAFIHSLRLCFVEFLLKFYEGGGKDYTPFKLKTLRPVIVGGTSWREV